MRFAPPLAFAACLAACGPRALVYRSPDLLSRLPQRVAVLPFDNETVDLRGPELLRELVAERLAARGHTIVPAEEVDAALRGIGVTDGGQLKAFAPAEVGRAVGAEGLFYGTLEDFVHQNLGFVRRRMVRLRVKLIEAGSGERLWEAVGRDEYSRVVLKPKKAGRAFVEGVAEEAAEGALGRPLLPESRRAVSKLFRPYPRR